MVAQRVGIGAVIGILLGVGFFYLSTFGYFEKWTRLPDPPTELIEITVDATGEVFGKATSGELITCRARLNECWINGTLPKEEWRFANTTKPCVYSQPEFFLLSNAPSTIADCAQVKWMIGDGSGHGAFVLDGDGAVWEWSTMTSAAYVAIFICVMPLAGAGLGALAGLILNVLMRRRAKTAMDK